MLEEERAICDSEQNTDESDMSDEDIEMMDYNDD